MFLDELLSVLTWKFYFLTTTEIVNTISIKFGKERMSFWIAAIKISVKKLWKAFSSYELNLRVPNKSTKYPNSTVTHMWPKCKYHEPYATFTVHFAVMCVENEPLWSRYVSFCDENKNDTQIVDFESVLTLNQWLHSRLTQDS